MTLSLLSIFAFAATGAAAGLIGALVGIGGGIIIVPTLVLFFGLDIKVAVAASLVSIVASSTSAGSVYVGKGLANMRLAMILEVATTLGGISGGLIALWIAPNLVSGIFGALLLVIAGLMLKTSSPRAVVLPLPNTGPRALTGVYFDEYQKKTVEYTIVGIPFGCGVSYFAGILSGLLGIGGGFIKVPAMNLGMNVPMIVATATSNFMIGVTAISSLFVYFARGYVQPLVAAPIAVGVVGGAFIGTKISSKISPLLLKRVFSVILFLIAVQMLLRATGVLGGS